MVGMSGALGEGASVLMAIGRTALAYRVGGAAGRERHDDGDLPRRHASSAFAVAVSAAMRATIAPNSLTSPAVTRVVCVLGKSLAVMAGLVPAIPFRRARCSPKRGHRDITAVTPLFDGLCPVTTIPVLALTSARRYISASFPRHSRLQ
jgi:hypothetical protein